MRQRVLIVLFGALIAGHTRAVWTDMNTGINDDLTGVWFWGIKGVVCGAHGIYYTTTGGVGPASWTRFDIPGSPADDAKYDRTKFTAASAESYTQNVAYFSGTDTVNQVAIIMKVDIVALSYSFLYTGASPSALNDIHCSGGGNLLAVGDQGLFLHSTNMGTSFTPLASGTTADLLCVNGVQQGLAAGGEGVVVKTFPVTAITCPYDIHGVTWYSGGWQAGVGSALYNMNPGIVENRNYDPWPLNGTDIVRTTSRTWVATKNGIYKGPISATYLELQPSSEGFALNDLMFFDSQSGYAAGDQGVLLSTTDGGGGTIPYSAIITAGGCAGMPITIQASVGTGNCEWFLDGAPLHTGCGAFTALIDTSGMHALMLTSTNTYTTDTSEVLVAVVDTPQIDLPLIGLDTVLCKGEALSFSIANTQSDIIYSCRDITHNLTIASANGTGGTILLVTDTIGSTADILLEARHNLVGACVRTFSDTIHIRVEETQARFHGDLINATPTEGVNFDQLCVDAQHFAWSFGTGASPTSSSLADPAGILFSTLGQAEVQLICWSDHGCYDTIVAPGPFVYIEPTPTDTCWAMQVPGDDPPWPGHYTEKISDALNTGDGFLICGTSYDQSLPSRIGNGIAMWPEGGIFLAKYSYAGVLKWVVYGKDDHYTTWSNFEEPNFYNMCLTPTGNIIISGGAHYAAWFGMNNGDSIQMADQGKYFIAELGPRGDHHWTAFLSNARPWRVSVDHAGNIAVAGRLDQNAYYRWAGTDHSFGANVPSNDFWSFLMKVDPSGSPLWQTYFEFDDVNAGRTLNDMAMDSAGNIFVVGDWEHRLLLLSANGGPSHEFFPSQTNEYGHWLYATKYDANGQFLWAIAADYIPGNSSLGAVAPDNVGGCYVAGDNAIYPPDLGMNIYHSDGSVALLQGSGPIMVARLDPSGHFMWNNGTVHLRGSATGIHADSSGVYIGCYPLTGNVPWSGSMSSSNGGGQPFALNSGDYFVAHYSPNGDLQDLFLPSSTTTNIANLRENISVFRDTLGHVYMTGDLSSYQGIDYLGQVMTTASSDWDGIIAKYGSTPCFDIATALGSLPRTGPSLSVYPNPASTELHILLPEGPSWRLSIIDVLGRRTVPVERGSGEHVILSRASLPVDSGPIVLVAESNGQQLRQTVMLVEY
ncbi:MAG: hypothetical protein KA352_09480 [Flavobacteriales bacterium]|nr:hypothetical protein [Flavobacteriales bacterium]